MNNETSNMPNILIVDDNPGTAFITKTFLKLSGYSSKIAQNGLEAVKILSLEKYDLVIMDIEMPIMNGLEATKEIRKGKAGVFNKDIPIVALSSLSNNEIEKKCFLAGMNLYLYKPVSKYIINSMLQTFVI